MKNDFEQPQKESLWVDIASAFTWFAWIVGLALLGLSYVWRPLVWGAVILFAAWISPFVVSWVLSLGYVIFSDLFGLEFRQRRIHRRWRH